MSAKVLARVNISDDNANLDKPAKDSIKNADDPGKPVIEGAKLDQERTKIEHNSINTTDGASYYADRAPTAHYLHTESLFAPGALHRCEPRTIILANNAPVVTKQTFDVLIPFQNDNLCLQHVLYVPDMR